MSRMGSTSATSLFLKTMFTGRQCLIELSRLLQVPSWTVALVPRLTMRCSANDLATWRCINDRGEILSVVARKPMSTVKLTFKFLRSRYEVFEWRKRISCSYINDDKHLWESSRNRAYANPNINVLQYVSFWEVYERHMQSTNRIIETENRIEILVAAILHVKLSHWVVVDRDIDSDYRFSTLIIFSFFYSFEPATDLKSFFLQFALSQTLANTSLPLPPPYHLQAPFCALLMPLKRYLCFTAYRP